MRDLRGHLTLAAFTLLIGVLFALGLGISGMTNPKRVLGFLDVAGNWDPSLMFVMGSALIVHMMAYRIRYRMQRPLAASDWSQIPKSGAIDLRLLAGATVFGVGWGLAGYCPGPAVVSLVTLRPAPILFVVSMLAGMLVVDRLRGRFKGQKGNSAK